MKILYSLFKKINPSRFHLALVLASIAVVLLLSYIYKQKTQIDEGTKLIKALNDTVTVYKTKDGKNAATISVIQVSNRKQAIEIAKARNENIALRLEKDKNIVTITEFSTLTRIDTVVKVNTISVISDKDTTTSFSKTIKNDFYTAEVVMVRDSLALGIQVYNKFTVAHKEVPGGLFKEDKYVVDVVNDNPHTINTGLSSYEIRPKKKNRFLKGVAVGAAAVLGGIILLK